MMRGNLIKLIMQSVFFYLFLVQYDDGTTIQYAYDAAGNRLVQQVTAFGQMMSLPGGESSPTGQPQEIPADAPTLQNFRAPAGGQ